MAIVGVRHGRGLISSQSTNEATRLMSAISYMRSAMMPAPPGLNTGGLPPLFELLDDGTARDLKPHAAAQLDVGRAFARQVLHAAPTLAVSAAPGIDPRVLHYHSRRAMHHFHLRDAALAAVLITVVALRPIPAAVWLLAFAVWTYPIKKERKRLRVLRWVVLAAAAGGVIELFFRAPGLALAWSSPLLGIVAAAAVFVVDAVNADRHIRAVLAGRDIPLAAAAEPRSGSRLERIMREHAGTAVAYDQNHIIGVGAPVYSAPVNIKLVTKDKVRVSRPIEPGELLTRISDALEALRKPDNVQHGVEELEVVGVRVGPIREWGAETSEELAESYDSIVNLPVSGRSKRAYVRARAVLWDGQVVPSVYVGATLEGDLLRFIFRQYILHPIGATAGACEDLVDSRQSARRLIRHATVELGLLGAALRGVLEELRTPPRLRGGSKGESDPPPIHSLRETYARRTRDLHMTEDAARFLHNVTVTVFGEAVAFLESRGVDVSEFKRQAQMIINNNIGGDVVGSNVQMGDGRIQGSQIVHGQTS